MNKLVSKNNLLGAFPSALAEDKKQLALASVTASELVELYEANDVLALYARIDDLDEPLLDILAYDFKIDWWDENYSLTEKRETFKQCWNVHRGLGTAAAPELAISAIYQNATILEWHEYGGKPFYFKLRITSENVMTDYEKLQKVINGIHYYKNKRSILEKIEVDIQQGVQVYVGITRRQAITEQVKCNIPNMPDMTFLADEKGRILADASGAWIAI